MAKPLALVLTGYGINCDDETAFALDYVGAQSRVVHINDLIDDPGQLDSYQIFLFPGGFSYGDDTGSGKALANRITNNLLAPLSRFIERDTLVLGICNGFQVMVNIGIVPGFSGDIGTAEVALEHNKSFRYQCSWVDCAIEKDSPSVFTRGIERLHIPVAHGEGNFFAPDAALNTIEENNLVAMRYTLPDGAPAQGHFPENPNGSLHDIASVCDRSGRVMGMMPHPERGMFFTQRDDWPLIRERLKREGNDIPKEADGVKIFYNAVRYFE